MPPGRITPLGTFICDARWHSLVDWPHITVPPGRPWLLLRFGGGYVGIGTFFPFQGREGAGCERVRVELRCWQGRGASVFRVLFFRVFMGFRVISQGSWVWGFLNFGFFRCRISGFLRSRFWVFRVYYESTVGSLCRYVIWDDCFPGRFNNFKDFKDF